MFLLCANDTKILCINLDSTSITDIINIEMPKVTERLSSDKLYINTNKRVAMSSHEAKNRSYR